MKSLLVLILAIIITLYSTSDVALSMTCESRSQDDDCADPQNYFLNYGQLNCTKYYIADGLEAQWTFIRNRDIGVSRHKDALYCILINVPRPLRNTELPNLYQTDVIYDYIGPLSNA